MWPFRSLFAESKDLHTIYIYTEVVAGKNAPKDYNYQRSRSRIHLPVLWYRTPQTIKVCLCKTPKLNSEPLLEHELGR